ncbi:MAG: DUF4271 domain-containing protein, partial [Bacteroidaceae bacterium]
TIQHNSLQPDTTTQSFDSQQTVTLIKYPTAPTTNDTTATTTTPLIVTQTTTDTTLTNTSTLDPKFLLAKYGFFKDSKWFNENDTVRFIGISGDPIPYKLSNDIFVTSTLLACLFIACFVISRSAHAIGLQIKNFFYNRDRKESFLLKSEGEVKNHIFVVILESFVLSLLFFSYAEFKLSDSFTTISPYLILLNDMVVCTAYFIIKYAVYGAFNHTFFSSDSNQLWFTGYNLVIFGKAITLLPVVLIVLYLNLPLEVCIYLFLGILTIYELLVLYKTRQIFFNHPLGFVPTILYFCTLELLPLFFLWEVLVKTNEFLLI